MTTSKLVLLGGTGMAGGCVLRLALDDPRTSRVTAIGRHAPGIEHAKLATVQHHDLLDYDPARDALAGQDAALFCLGTYTGTVTDDALRRITVDAAVAFGKALRTCSPQAALCFLSGQGADPTGRSRMAFARYKGVAEQALLDLAFPRLHIFRPGYIYPVEPRVEPTFAYRLARSLYPVLRRLYANIGVRSVDLARAMVLAAMEGTPGHPDLVLENRDIRQLSARSGDASARPAPTGG